MRWTPSYLTIVRLVALAATGVAVVLLVTSVIERGHPPGCGEGSGCAEVLTSRWSAVFNVPISVPALATYLTVLLATFGVNRQAGESLRRCSSWLLLFLAVLLLLATVWFVGLQLIVLRAVCPWCMADHVLGAILAGLILSNRGTSAESDDADSDDPETDPAVAPTRAVGLVQPAIAAVLALAVLVVAQWVVPYRGPGVARLPAGVDADSGPGPARQVAVLSGKLVVAPHDEPRLGDPDAPKLVLLMYDYCCPHCRQAHEFLLEAPRRFGDRVCVVLLPMPRDSDCNPHIEKTEKRFEAACELAQLALGVWRAAPAKFPEFDRWLFEPEMPREPAEARREAERLVGQAALEQSLADPWIGEQIRRNCDAHAASQADYIPVLLSPGMRPMIGRHPTADELFAELTSELGMEGR